ncbi:NCS2 family permease [Vallitalea okinawensis]|uniref:NCS2 family permease n=1 Tax=Vallitalea okinawensis TaxID=2078660 RepID=UPI000CFDF0B5|nr:NCS2 family permease [Vallitalea okinawensis]
MFEKYFKLSENNTTVRKEIIAGLTTFVTMAYILAVNPGMLSATGMDAGAVFTATALAAVIGTLAMALFSNYPFALAPGMGLNAFFTFSVVLGMGKSWETALFAVFVEGILFIILTAFNIREAIFNAIPKNLKYAVSAGIGLFIAFIGLQGAGIVGDNPATLVSLGNITSAQAALACFGVLIIAILSHFRVRGAILIGILITYVLGIGAELAGWYIVNPEVGAFSLIPSFANGLSVPSLEPIVFFGAFKGDGFNLALNMDEIMSLEFFAIVFAFLFVDLFDTLGTLIGVSSKAGYLDKEGKLPKAKQALFADSLATTAGAVLGTSTTTTYVESAAGVAEGGRTGLTGVVVAILFTLALFLSPIFLAIPAFATAPALIIVGFFMLDGVKHIEFDDFSEAVPAFITMIAMPLTYSISEGIVFGVVSYVIINGIIWIVGLFSGKEKANKIHPVLAVLCLIFLWYLCTK